jgi:sodium-dependent dicarboxylate transporter 2/3/5
MVRWLGLLGGPALAAALFAALPSAYPNHAGESVALEPAARCTLALMAWMATWWITEAIDVSATALLPLVVLPLAGVSSMAKAAAPYASDVVFLFMGGFILALSMQRWGLDRRIALTTLRLVGTKPRNIVGGFMLATAAISAFVSNTATAAMMLPIGLSVIDLMRKSSGREPEANSTRTSNFAVCLMLGIAYASSIGGVATIIGTPPNALLVGFLRESTNPDLQREISFASWLLIGVPLAAAFLPVAWLLLTRVLFPVDSREIEGGGDFIRSATAELGRPNRGEAATLIVFMITALAWTARPVLAGGLKGGADPATGESLMIIPPIIPSLSDAGIAMIAAMALMVIPVDARRGEFVMDWAHARKLPWGVLILFGGGLSLASAIELSGVDDFLGGLAAAMQGVPTFALILLITAAMVFFSELASNTAAAATAIPILAAAAPALGVDPMMLVIPATLASSLAFMMPAGTPPNALVFGSGHVTIPQMCKAGFWLNLIGIGLIVAATYAIVLPLLGSGR